MKYETVIGLEIHSELKTNSKIFCSCGTQFGAEQNTNICPGCLALPGTLPVLNEKTVELGARAGLALNCRVVPFNRFDRKHYYYPDISKNYQNSQFEFPVAVEGYVDIEVDGQTKRIRINRVHIEEDAGKLVHAETAYESYALVDYNRAGMPLIEIVSEPDLSSPQEVRAYLEKIKAILQYTDVSYCRMEEGSLRCDANISLRPAGETKLGTKAELKNMNSFKAIQKGLEYEIARQAEILDSGGKVIQETRSWDDVKGITFSMRNKEQADDYRYFPDPDLAPVILEESWIEAVKNSLPELPDARKNRLTQKDGLSGYDAEIITASREMADYYDETVKTGAAPKQAANWLMGDLSKNLNSAGLSILECPVSAVKLAGLIKLIEKGTISGKIAKTVFEEMWQNGQDALTVVQEKGLVQITDESAVVAVVEEVIAKNPQSAADFKAGKEKAIGFLVGQVMKQTKGRANPDLVNRLLKEKL